MKKSVVVALMAVFSVFAVGASFATVDPKAEGNLTLDKPAAVWPKKKLNADGTKKKGPVTFTHKKHGEAGCVGCHHTQKDLTAASAATIKVAPCFECHGPELKVVDGKNQIDSYEMIHGKAGVCLKCHKELKAKDPASKAPTACKECHGGADE